MANRDTSQLSNAYHRQFIESLMIEFAMFCDTEGLTSGEGVKLAEIIAGELEEIADDRRYQDNVLRDDDESDTVQP